MKPMRRVAGYFLVFFAAVLTAVALNGCGGGGGGPSDDSPPPPPAEIVVSSAQLDFGGIVAGNFTDRTITIQNTGTGDLTLDQIAVSAAAAASYAVPSNLDQCSGQTITPSASCTVAVRFQPAEQGDYNFSSGLTIPSNDSDENLVNIALNGRGRGLNVSINRVDTTDCGATPATLRLLVAVTDPNGDPVPGLTQDAFSLFEDGTLKVISAFTPPPQAAAGALSVGLALDYSRSTIPSTATLEAAATGFIDQLDAGDEAEIIKFSVDVLPVQAYITDKLLLKAKIVEPFPLERTGTSLFDAIILAVDNAALRNNLRRAVIVVSDGEDLHSANTLDGTILHAVQNGIPLYTIAIGEAGIENMQRLADETGGQHFFAQDPDSVQAIYTKIIELLSNQYVITYDTSSAGGATVSIDIEVDSGGLQGEDSKDATGC